MIVPIGFGRYHLAGFSRRDLGNYGRLWQIREYVQGQPTGGDAFPRPKWRRLVEGSDCTPYGPVRLHFFKTSCNSAVGTLLLIVG
jgi:hypothetical protein